MKRKGLIRIETLCIIVASFVVSSLIFTSASSDYQYDMDFIPYHLRLKLNVYDWKAASLYGQKVPLSNVTFGVNRISDYNNGIFNTDYYRIFDLTSDGNGIAYIDIPFTVSTPSNGRTIGYLYGIEDVNHSFFDSVNNDVNKIRYDIAPITNGYSLNVSKTGLIRNVISASNAGAVHKTAGTSAYDDFHFDGGVTKDYGTYTDGGGTIHYGGGAAIEYDIYVETNNFSISFKDYNIENWDNADYPTQIITPGGVATEPSIIPVNKINDEIEFLGWMDEATGELFDFSSVVTKSALLIPKWGPNPNARGYIHLNSYLWVHDLYDGSYGSGQTNTTVNNLEYTIEYYDQAVAGTTQWNTLKTVMVDDNGKADIVLTPEDLELLSNFRNSISILGDGHYATIDIGAKADSYGWHSLKHDSFPILNKYGWDLIRWDDQYGHGSGVTGVRTMDVNTSGVYDLVRDNNAWVRGKFGDDTSSPIVGNVQYASNVNHVPWITQDMLENGFEITWNCYVSPTTIVEFDLDGGTGVGDYSTQEFPYITSLPEQHIDDFYVVEPINPVRGNDPFVGWYKVVEDGLEGIPWDFDNRIVVESMKLKAVYASNLYSVIFEQDNGEANQSGLYPSGSLPVWRGENPVKASDGMYMYEFVGWEEITGANVGNEYFFTSDYDAFNNEYRPLYSSDSLPVVVDGSFDRVTVYKAIYREIPIFPETGGSGRFLMYCLGAICLILSIIMRLTTVLMR